MNARVLLIGGGVGLLLVAWVTPAAVGQLTPEDIAALRERGRREGWTFTVGENDATRRPIEQLCGVVEPPDWRWHGRFDDSQPRRDLPSYFDWRDYGAVTGVRNQGACGSCWAFSVIAPVESNIFLEDAALVDLSEQWLVSCCGLGGCSGEWPGTAVQFLHCDGVHRDYCQGYGAVLESSFPYLGVDGACGCPYDHPYCLTDWAYIGPQWGVPSVAQLKQAIYDHGPISVCVNASGAFMAYNGGVFNSCDNSEINHAVTLVGWDDSQGPEGVWFMKNSWGAGWGEDGYMRIAYGCCLIGYAALWVDYPGLPPSLAFAYPDGRPQVLDTGVPRTVRVDITGRYDGVVVENSGLLHYAIDGGAWQTAALTQLAPGAYLATLPALACMQQIQWYVSALEATVGRVSDPLDAPAHSWAALARTSELPVLSTDFEVDTGWTVINQNLLAGAWERGVPAGDGTRGDPTTDADGSGCCYLTGNAPGDSDVDGGPTRLISPLLDLSAGEYYRLTYSRWFFNNNEDGDRLRVEVSNNGGITYTLVEEAAHAPGWHPQTFTLNDYTTPSAAVRLRFSVSDNPSNSITEAGVDAVRIVRLGCEGGGPNGDLNCDGQVGFADINAFVLALSDPAAYALEYPDCSVSRGDINGDGQVGFGDINPFVALLTQ